MIAAYVRVSSHSQMADSQKVELKTWLKRQGYILDDVQWFEDVESGSTLERPGFKSLQEAVFSGAIQTVVVWKLDRLARNLRDGVNILADWCEKGVRVVSITQQLDLSGAAGRLIAGVLFAVAEMEREQIRERQAIGISLAKEKGVYKGRKKGTTKSNPERAEELKNQGLTAAEIATVLSVSERTIFNYLRAEVQKSTTLS